LAAQLAHNEKPIGKIDDVVHDWDVIYQSQTSKCSEALDVVVRLTSDLY